MKDTIAPPELKVHYPFKPFRITQMWGIYNPDYIPLGFSEHNGIDANVGRSGDIEYQTRFPVYCPVEGFKVESISWEPQGGGNQISLISKEKVQVGDKACYARIFLCHAKKILVRVGDEPKVGELLMIGNNTGFSTGPHTHIGLYRLSDSFQKLDVNNSTGSYNPALFFTDKYAIDNASLSTFITNGLRLAAYYAGV